MPQITDRCVHNDIKEYMLYLLIDIAAEIGNGKSFKPIDGYRLAILPVYIEKLDNCDRPHKDAVASMEWLVDQLTQKDWRDKLDYEEARKWLDASQDLEYCREPLWRH